MRRIDGSVHIALIEPRKSEAEEAELATKNDPAVLTLPKGLLDPGEKPQAAAVREVYEETGLRAEIISKIADSKYTYTRHWSDGQRVFKIVTFYLMRYVSGEIGDISSAMEIEVKRALWVPLGEAPKRMAYGGEKKVVLQAMSLVESA